MPEEVLVLFFGSLFGIGGIILIGQWMRYKYDPKYKRSDETAKLGDAVDALREDMQLLEDRMHGLDERVEFTERVLADEAGRQRRDALPGPPQ